MQNNSLVDSISEAIEFLIPGLDVEYLEADAFDLGHVKDMKHPNPIVACLVVRIDGGVYWTT